MTKEELLSNQTFIDLFKISSEIDKIDKELELLEIAKNLKCYREFNRKLKIYEKEFSDKTYFDNEIEIKDIPLNGLHLNKFTCNSKGIFKKGELICYTSVIICELLINKTTKNEKAKLSYYDKKTKKWNYCVVDTKTLSSANKILKLADFKIRVNSENAREMVKYFDELISENIDIIPNGECYSSLGWHNNEFAPYNYKILDDENDFKQIKSAIVEQGNYEKWFEVVKQTRKNKYVQIAMATTFASPLLEKVNIMPFIVNLCSSTSGNGKTVGCMIAMSSWGDPTTKGLQFSSDSTLNYYMKVASFLKNITMYCDEFQKIKSSVDLSELIMTLANGKDKGRLNIDRKVEEEYFWNNTFLFTNNDRLAKSSYGEQVFNRIIDVECNETVVEEGNSIVKVISNNYGFGGKIYIDYISKIGFEKINKRVQEYIKELCNNYSTTPKQASCIATILVANELSQECLFTDEKRLTIEDIKDCINDKNEIETWRKAYQYIINDFAINSKRFEQDNNGEIWGKAIKGSDGQIYGYTINKTKLIERLEKRNYEFDIIKKLWEKNEIIKRNSQGRFCYSTAVYGQKGIYVVINIKEKYL